jgi:UDPglucose 6-dehydrogenase
MYEIYRPLTLNEPPIVFTDRRSSEMIKYAANAFLALKITFINEIADLCEKINADVQQIARGIGLDNRIGSKFLHPGPGFGGSCFPKDTQALVKTARDAGAPLRIIETVMSVNDARKVKMTERVIQACGGSVQNKKIAILGLAFKPNTDDLREAPALEIINGLSSAGARIFAYDPQAMPSAKKLLPNIELADDAYSCVRGAEVLVIVTEWDEFRALDLDRIKKLMQLPVIVDLRNIYRPKEIFDQGFKYFSIGR